MLLLTSSDILEAKMEFSSPPYDSLWKYFRDVALAFCIIVGGFLVAGAIATPFDDSDSIVQ